MRAYFTSDLNYTTKYLLICQPNWIEKVYLSLRFYMKKICSNCYKEKEIDDFYQKKDRKNGSSQCKKCFNLYCCERWAKTKKKAIEYKGSKCKDCNLTYPDSDSCIFDFHHVDPAIKESDWKKLRIKAWNKIINELDKCDLLCSNCHRLRHKKMSQAGIEPALDL